MAKSSELFQKCRHETSGVARKQQLESALYYLQSAFDHSVLAVKATCAMPEEESLIFLIRALVPYLYAALAMMEKDFQLRSRESALRQFLKENGNPAAAKHIARGSRQLLEDVSDFFKIVDRAFMRLKDDILGRMNDNERLRYKNACDSLEEHMATRHHQRHLLRHGRISGPALFAKYELA